MRLCGDQGGVFFLLQTEHGDVFQLRVKSDALRLRYFDTLFRVNRHSPSSGPGFVLVCGEAASHCLYQFQALGDHDDEPVYTTGQGPQTFSLRPLRNLALIDQIENYAPLTDAMVLNLGNEETPQTYTAQGKGRLSTFNIMRHGLAVAEVAVTSVLPQTPTGVWALPRTSKDAHDAFIVVSFAAATTVLSVGESVEEVSDSGFLDSTATLGVGLLADNSFVQVTPKDVRQIRPDRPLVEWRVPEGTRVLQCASNTRQVVLYLDNRTLVYLELQLAGDVLSEQRTSPPLPEAVCALALGPVSAGEQRSRFMAMGCLDSVVRVLSLAPDDYLEPVGLQALAAKPVSLLMTELADASLESVHKTLFLDMGLENGVLVRMRLDGLTGVLSDARSRFLGLQPVRLAHVKAEGSSAVLALSSRPWLSYSRNGHLTLSPLFYEPLSCAAAFASEQCPSGMVAIAKRTLCILLVEDFGVLFSRHRVPLEYTPRRLAFHPQRSLFALVCGENRALGTAEHEAACTELGVGAEALRESNVVLCGARGRWAAEVLLFNPFQVPGGWLLLTTGLGHGCGASWTGRQRGCAVCSLCDVSRPAERDVSGGWRCRQPVLDAAQRNGLGDPPLPAGWLGQSRACAPDECGGHPFGHVCVWRAASCWAWQHTADV